MGSAVAEKAVVGRSVFEAGGVDYCWGDVVVAARLRGDWDAVEQAAGRGLAALRELHVRGKELDADAVEQAAAEWRYERNLLSADELEQWLGRWDLNVCEWSDWVAQALMRERFTGPPDTTALDRDEVESAAAIEAICSGALHGWARELAQRAAVAAPGGAAPTAAPAREPSPARGVLGLEPAEWQASVAKVAPLDIPVDDAIAATLDDADVEREVDLRRADWLTFDCRLLRLTEEGVAREAACCIRDDGRPPEEVAAAARTPFERTSFVLEDAPPALRARLIGAQVGELVGPVADGSAFVVALIDGKRRPDIRDADIAFRARRRAQERALRREVDARVRWHERV